MNDTQLLGLTLSKQIEQAAQRELELLRENAALREDKERLDCGCIIVREMDEMGNFVPVLHTGINLRAAIDAARKEAKP